MATALLTPDTLPTSCDEAAEIRTWEADDAGNLRPFEPYYREDPAMNTQTERRVRQLVTWEAEDSDALMRDLQDDLRRGNRRVAQMLAAAFYQRGYDADARSLALETLAAARVRWFEQELVELVRSALDAPEPELQFAGIAAAGDLSRARQVAVSRVIKTLAGSDAADQVREAAEAFLRKVNRSNLVRL